MCRRIGSKAATGEYTNFLDSDDWLAPDFIETMYNEAKKENAVIVSCGIIIADDNINKDWEIVNYREREVYTNPNTVSLLSGWIGRFLNNKLIKRDLWDKVEYSGETDVNVRYSGTIAQATAAIDELHDSTAYNNSATNAAIPAALVCSDGTLAQSLFNS